MTTLFIYIYNILHVCMSGRPPWGKGVTVSTPFTNVFQKKKKFLSVDFAEDTKVANTYSFEFQHLGSQWHAFTQAVVPD
jgi:hypothetical protein